MMTLCQEKGVPLMVISAPKTTLDVISYQTYFEDYAYFKQLCAQYGAAYYDFNLAKPELFMSVEPDYYSDQTHMNRTGGRAFCQSMAAFLDLLEHGQDVESLFITPDEYLANADFITNVYITPEVHPDKVVLLATSYQGPAVKPEYEFWAKGPMMRIIKKSPIIRVAHADSRLQNREPINFASMRAFPVLILRLTAIMNALSIADLMDGVVWNCIP